MKLCGVRPATGDGSSALILSVMISASDSSLSTQSPSFLSQAPTVPSATDSPSRGIFTGVGICVLLCIRATARVAPYIYLVSRELASRGCDFFGVWQECGLQGRCIGKRCIGRGYARDWPVKVLEDVFDQDGR